MSENFRTTPETNWNRYDPWPDAPASSNGLGRHPFKVISIQRSDSELVDITLAGLGHHLSHMNSAGKP